MTEEDMKAVLYANTWTQSTQCQEPEFQAPSKMKVNILVTVVAIKREYAIMAKINETMKVYDFLPIRKARIVMADIKNINSE